MLDGAEVRDDGLSQQRLESTPRHTAYLSQHLLLAPVGHCLVDVEQVLRLGSVWVVPLQPLEQVRLALLDLR